MKQYLLIIPVLALNVLFWACAPSTPGGILDEDDMEDILVDYHLAQGMAEGHAQDIEVTRYKYIQAVFRKHHVTEAEFDSSMVYYSGRSEEFAHIYNNVLTRVRVQAERMGLEATTTKDQFANLTNEGDTANIWLGKDFACIQPDAVHNTYSFQMQADTTFHPGDDFIWRFNSLFVANSPNNEAIALLNFYFEGDTVVCVTDFVRSMNKNELRLSSSGRLDSLQLRSVAGYIFLPNSESGTSPKPMLISDLTFIRMHKKPIELPKPTEAAEEADSLESDTLLSNEPFNTQRLTPLQMRENQPRERKIHVTKENPNPIHPQRGLPQRNTRRKQGSR